MKNKECEQSHYMGFVSLSKEDLCDSLEKVRPILDKASTVHNGYYDEYEVTETKTIYGWSCTLSNIKSMENFFEVIRTIGMIIKESKPKVVFTCYELKTMNKIN